MKKIIIVLFMFLCIGSVKANTYESTYNLVDTKLTINENDISMQHLANTTSTNQNIEKIDVCNSDTLKVFKVIGYLIITIKILVPCILIILGSIDIGKAALSGDEKELKQSFSVFVKRAFAGIIIFFVPTIVDYFLVAINTPTSENVDTIMGKYKKCTDCMFNPTDEDKCQKEIVHGGGGRNY